MVGKSDGFLVKVSSHHGLTFSSILFNIVFNVIKENVKVEPQGCILYADDIVLVTESRVKMELDGGLLLKAEE